jgi:hypothetical protein
MFTVTAKALLMLMSLSITPSSVKAPERVSESQLVKSKDEDLVKAACRLWWNLPDPTSTSARGLAKWAKQNLPAASSALTKAAQAKKLNKKWASFELDMVTFWGALSLGTDVKYSRIMFTSTIEKTAMNNLGKTCAKRR